MKKQGTLKVLSQSQGPEQSVVMELPAEGKIVATGMGETGASLYF